MEQQLRRYFVGAVGFAFVLTWVTLGGTIAVVATIVCLAGTRLDRLVRPINSKERGSGHGARAKRSKLAARPLSAEGGYDLVPDEPSLIISAH